MNNFEKRIAYFCANDCSLFAKLFAFTHHPKTQSTAAVPLILTEPQEQVVKKMENAVEGCTALDLAIKHERESGASWLIALFSAWSVLLKCDTSTHVVARTERFLVNDHSSFLFRFDYIMSRLPEWLKPHDYTAQSFKSYRGFHNEKTNSMITIASSGEPFIRDRKNIVIFDDFDSCEDALDLYRSAETVAQSRVVVSADHEGDSLVDQIQADMELELPAWGQFSQ